MAHHRHEMHRKAHEKREHEAKRASGGRTDFYAGGESEVAKEAEEKKRGGKVGHKGREKMRKGMEKLMARRKKDHEDERRGEKKEMGKVHGEHAKKRMDRPGRKRGGSVGADMHPLSTASRVTRPQEGHKVEKEPDVEGG